MEEETGSGSSGQDGSPRSPTPMDVDVEGEGIPSQEEDGIPPDLMNFSRRFNLVSLARRMAEVENDNPAPPEMDGRFDISDSDDEDGPPSNSSDLGNEWEARYNSEMLKEEAEARSNFVSSFANSSENASNILNEPIAQQCGFVVRVEEPRLEDYDTLFVIPPGIPSVMKDALGSFRFRSFPQFPTNGGDDSDKSLMEVVAPTDDNELDGSDEPLEPDGISSTDSNLPNGVATPSDPEKLSLNVSSETNSVEQLKEHEEISQETSRDAPSTEVSEPERDSNESNGHTQSSRNSEGLPEGVELVQIVVSNDLATPEDPQQISPVDSSETNTAGQLNKSEKIPSQDFSETSKATKSTMTGPEKDSNESNDHTQFEGLPEGVELMQLDVSQSPEQISTEISGGSTQSSSPVGKANQRKLKRLLPLADLMSEEMTKKRRVDPTLTPPTVVEKQTESIKDNCISPLLKCEDCGKRFLCFDDNLFRKHMLLEHNREITDYKQFDKWRVPSRQLEKCKKCDTFVLSRDEHHPTCGGTVYDNVNVEDAYQQLLKHKCCLCEESYSARYELARHIEAVHDTIKSKVILYPSFRCGQCLGGFDTAWDLMKHCVICVELQPKPETIEELARLYLKCDICRATHPTTDEANDCYFQRNILRCFVCLDAYNSEEGLLEHLAAHHGPQMDSSPMFSMKCPFCPNLGDYQEIFPHIVVDHYFTQISRSLTSITCGGPDQQQQPQDPSGIQITSVMGNYNPSPQSGSLAGMPLIPVRPPVEQTPSQIVLNTNLNRPTLAPGTAVTRPGSIPPVPLSPMFRSINRNNRRGPLFLVRSTSGPSPGQIRLVHLQPGSVIARSVRPSGVNFQLARPAGPATVGSSHVIRFPSLFNPLRVNSAVGMAPRQYGSIRARPPSTSQSALSTRAPAPPNQQHLQ